jgi:hypothetical protein
MTSAQTDLYFFEWGRVRKHYVAKGIDPKQADAKRHALHVKALGVAKSSKKFTNADLDKVLAVFRAVSDGGNLDAQLDLLEQDKKRAALVLSRLAVLRVHLGLEPGRESAYVAGIAKKLFGPEAQQYQHLSDVQLAQLEGTVVRRLYQLHSAERVEEIRNQAAEHAAAIGAIVAPAPAPAAALGEAF